MFTSLADSISRRIAVALLVLLVAVLVAGCSGTSPAPSAPSTPTPEATYPFIDLTPGSTWTYRLVTEGGEATSTWTVVGTGTFNGDPSAVKMEERINGALWFYHYWKQEANGVAQLGSEVCTEEAGGPVVRERAVYSPPLVFPSNLKQGEVFHHEAQFTTTRYFDESGNPLETPSEENELYQATYTVGALERIMVGEVQVSAYKITDGEGSSYWIGPNGIGVVKMNPSLDGDQGYFLESYDIK